MGDRPRIDTDILVVGAGPVGLTVALQARVMGAKVRVVECRDEPRKWAPALAIQPRTMEVLRGLDVAHDVLARGVSDANLHIHIGRTTVKGRLYDLHLPETEYPFICFVSQSEVEQALRERLAESDVEVEWGSEFVALNQDESLVHSRVKAADGSIQEISSRYVVGCDGRESTVRRDVGISFRGRRYRQSIVISDAQSIGGLTPGVAHAFVERVGIAFFFPLRSGRWRVIAPGRVGGCPPDLAGLVETHTSGKVQLGATDWVKALTPHHRLASRFSVGRVFLAGDAAHTHSPAGAQGMNTGIQDGVNLAWKLAAVSRGAPPALLDTYDIERRPVARRVVAFTGLAYAIEVSDHRLLRIGRRIAAKPVAGLVVPRPRLISIVARVVAGLDIGYRRGAFGETGAWRRGFRPGTRLCDLPLAEGRVPRLHHLKTSGFDLLVFDEGVLDDAGDVLARFDGVMATQTIDRASMPRNCRRYPGFALVRPDGYVAVSGEVEDAGRIGEYLKRWLGTDKAWRLPERTASRSLDVAIPAE